jgi:hypothetical protein
MPFQVGERVGDYEIVGVLGTGGMGQVYKVRNVISERLEAMKVLLPNLEGDPALADRFLREIKVLATLDHPNIASLRTAFRSGNQLVMVMELVEGVGLDERVRQGPIPVAEALDYFCQALSALDYAHSRGVIHRDIKPANLMVTPQGVVKLMDFGIAKPAGDRQLTRTGTTLGSLYYMSPEQVTGGPLDARSDIYSMGVALYEVLTGTRPFKGDSEFSIMAAHLEGQVVPPIQVNPLLGPVLNEIIMTAIAKDPAQRFQSAAAFRNALLQAKESLSAAAAPLSATGAVAAAPQPPAPAAQATWQAALAAPAPGHRATLTTVRTGSSAITARSADPGCGTGTHAPWVIHGAGCCHRVGRSGAGRHAIAALVADARSASDQYHAGSGGSTPAGRDADGAGSHRGGHNGRRRITAGAGKRTGDGRVLDPGPRDLHGDGRSFTAAFRGRARRAASDARACYAATRPSLHFSRAGGSGRSCRGNASRPHCGDRFRTSPASNALGAPGAGCRRQSARGASGTHGDAGFARRRRPLEPRNAAKAAGSHGPEPTRRHSRLLEAHGTLHGSGGSRAQQTRRGGNAPSPGSR